VLGALSVLFDEFQDVRPVSVCLQGIYASCCLTALVRFAPCSQAIVLCCAVLCCAVLCCAVLCCAVLCCAVLCCAVLLGL
jgi:hypothetical protein